jgi:hypothetical protein
VSSRPEEQVATFRAFADGAAEADADQGCEPVVPAYVAANELGAIAARAALSKNKVLACDFGLADGRSFDFVQLYDFDLLK